MTENRILLLCFICFLSFGACDDDDDGIPPATHGVSGGKELNTLTQEEVNQICEDDRNRTVETIDSSTLMSDPVRIGCTIAGLVYSANGGTKTECESARDQCIQRLNRFVADAGPAPPVETMVELPCPPVETLARCNASVSDFDACTNARLTAYQNALNEATAAANEISCNNAGQPFESDVFTATGEFNIRIQLPEACTSLVQQCPGTIAFQ